MALSQTKVSRCLEKRLKVLGFEIPDLLALCITVSILNFLFGQTSLSWALVWLPGLIMAGILHFGKRGKPPNHLLHWIRFQFRPGILSAFHHKPRKEDHAE